MRTGALQQQAPAMDTCWSVPVLAALTALVICLPVSYMGLIFVFFIEDYGLSRAQASWTQNALIVAVHLSGLLVGALQHRISVPNIILLSSSIATLGLCASALSRNVIWVAATLGAMYGLGVGMFLMSACIYNLTLFKKYKGTALTMTYLAWGIAGIYGPALLTRLRESYGLQGGLLICSATVFHSVPLSMLMRQPSLISLRCFKTLIKATKGVSVPLDDPSANSDSSHIENLCKNNIDRRTSATTIFEYSDFTEVEAVGSDPDTSHCTKRRQEPVIALKSHDHQRPASVFSAVVALLQAPAFYVFLSTTVIAEYSMISFGTTIVDYATDKGVELHAAAHLVTYGAVGYTIGRIFIVPLSDWFPKSRSTLYASCFVMEATSTILMPHVSTMPGIATLRVTETVAQGFVIAVRGVLLAHYMGIEKVATCTGLFGLAMIPVSLGSATIIGFFRDTIGSYDWFYRMLAALNAVMALELCLFFLTDCTRTRRQKGALSGVSKIQVDSEHPLAASHK